MKKYSGIIKRVLHTVILSGIVFSSFAQSDSIRPFHIGLVYPISSNGLKAADYTNRFSLHAIAGLSKSETSVAISGAANIVKQDANGAIISGAVNLIGNDARGAQIAGFANIIKNEAKGAQVAGFANITGSAESVQIAGFSNIVKDDAKGLQVSGFLNKGKNVSNQVAGFMNIAKNVKGVQLAGLINIADSSNYPIALLNFVKNGEKSVSLSLDETLTGMATFRSGGRVLYGILGIGYNMENDGKSLYAVESGLGAHFRISNGFRINTEIVSQQLSDFKKGHYSKHNIRLLPAFRVGRLELFAGPTINYVNYTQDKGYSFIKNYMWSKNGSKDFQGIYAGVVGGLKVIL
ncbi:hypothetical protein [Dyadobacter sp. CY312]|uniref:hypothetical protein n=1 Tax=Dyadobacter sp. CY312 TaxID=2907303 RepID=UPI001F24C417|nr:hypothetical protein [Dyadobacter sp. CY312]MCE7043200.1 hypothetical protein [Dyadobacter sp. CY312]